MTVVGLSQQGRHVKDERHRPIAQDGGARNALHALEGTPQWLDDRLEFAQQGVNDEAGALARVMARRRCLGARYRLSISKKSQPNKGSTAPRRLHQSWPCCR